MKKLSFISMILLSLMLLVTRAYPQGGYLQWAKNAGGGDIFGYDIAVDLEGNNYITGYFIGTATFDKGRPNELTLTSSGFSDDIFIAKYDADGVFLWARGIGSTTSDRGHSIAVDGKGNVHIAGYYSGSVTFGLGEPNEKTISSYGGGKDYFVAKFNKDGQFLWVFTADRDRDDNGLSVAVDNQGYVWAIATWNDGTYMFLIKIWPSGDDYDWYVDIPGTVIGNKEYSLDGTFPDVAIDNMGNAIVVAHTRDTGTLWIGGNIPLPTPSPACSLKVWIAKFNPAGEPQWASQACGGTEDKGVKSWSVATDAAGNSYVTGYFHGTVRFGPGEPKETQLTSIDPNLSDIFVAKWSQNGQLEWAKAAGGPENDQGIGIVADPDGNSYVTGYFFGSATFGAGDPNQKTITSSATQPQEEPFFAKYNTNGQLEWVTYAPGNAEDRGTAFAYNACSHAVSATGFIYTDDNTFGPGEPNETILDIIGVDDVFTAKFEAGGIPPAAICDILAGAQSSCNGKTARYSQEITVYYTNPPAGASLVVNGQTFPVTGSPQTVLLTDLLSGIPGNVTVGFSTWDEHRYVSVPGVYTAPDFCYCPPPGSHCYVAYTSYDYLTEIDPTNASTISEVTITLPGHTIYGVKGLAFHPTTGVLYAIIQDYDNSNIFYLATIDPTTGVATEIGVLGDKFAGIAFDAVGTLYGVTGDGASTPETMYTINITNAATAFFQTLGNGDDGETIAFNRSNGLMYHASGYDEPAPILETINLSTKAITNIDISGIAVGQPNHVILAMSYNALLDGFFMSDYSNYELWFMSADGKQIVYLGQLYDNVKGIACFIPPTTAIQLSSFSAAASSQGVKLSWITETELSNAGFNVYRSSEESGSYVKVNASLIPAIGNATTGANYEYIDQPVGAGTYYYKLEDVGIDGVSKFHGPIKVAGITSVAANEMLIPDEYELSQNYPNPFNPETRIQYAIPEAGHVLVTIFDVQGRVVRELVSKYHPAGYYEARWDSRDEYGFQVPSGVYFYRLKAGSFITTRKMILMK